VSNVVEISKEEQKLLREYGNKSDTYILYTILKELKEQRKILEKIEENTRK